MSAPGAGTAAAFPSFEQFFSKLRGAPPFPWQAMLAQEVAANGWPEVIDLPTAAGKTACIEIALYALAAGAGLLPESRRAPRRIWFVVDRRIVVDAAFAHALDIQGKLEAATGDDAVAAVAQRLRALSGGAHPKPLAVARLRGGIWRDDGWACRPSQPAVVCSTVDQLGSALLFRAYGHGPSTAAIWAGLAANDSLILLDEAHCARPFSETLAAVARLRGKPWCEQPLPAPFAFAVMSATPGLAQGDAKLFPRSSDRAAALDCDELRRRIGAAKPAKLHAPVKGGRDALAASLVDAAAGFIAAGRQRVAVMVNRVATARAVAEALSARPGQIAKIVLLTGRMRPLDRDESVRRWEPKLRAKDPEAMDGGQPVCVVATQCLEVGADFDFDALVTECASLDALRQRFGRLNRLGGKQNCAAAVLIQEADAKAKKPDPIYGSALRETWSWLGELGGGAGIADFGIAAMDGAVAALRAADGEKLAKLYPPAAHAPILLPAHLDMLCQTGPRPGVEPEPALFLHGPQAGPPEARVILRAGLPPVDQGGAEADWQEHLDLLPPSALEAFSVPLPHLRLWLQDAAASKSGEEEGDVEGRGAADDPSEDGEKRGSVRRPRPPCRPFGLWRREGKGAATLRLSADDGAAKAPPADPSQIHHGDTIIVRAEEEDLDALGQLPLPEDAMGLGPRKLDLAECATRLASGWIKLRVRKDLLEPWRSRPGIQALLAVAEDENAAEEDLERALQMAAEDPSQGLAGAEGPAPPALPFWLRGQMAELGKGLRRPEPLPGGGWLLTAKHRCRPRAAGDSGDDAADAEAGSSAGSKEISLRVHGAAVRAAAEEQAALCLPAFRRPLAWAAEHHDLGKLDRRFQMMLRDGEEPGAAEPLAKSAQILRCWRRKAQTAPEDALPPGFRHEMLSLAIARAVESGLEPAEEELALHLIASHHGRARPFAPVVVDAAPEQAQIEAALADYFPGGQPAPALGSVPAHRLDSGVADRFWRLSRRLGWWGLAYLEAILRLADWQASANAGGAPEAATPPPAVAWRRPCPAAPRAALELSAIDGANPLGFLAALGTLRLAHLAAPIRGVRLAWVLRGAAWRPTLEGFQAKDDLLQSLSAAPWAPAAAMVAGIGKDLTVPPVAFREFVATAASVPGLAAFAAAFGSETCAEERHDNRIARTPFCFITGSGHQHFLGTIAALAASTTPVHLEDALFGQWRLDKGSSMRWDPDDAAEYALLASDPGPEGAWAAWGANRLAIEALPLFPTAPAGRGPTPALAATAWHAAEDLTWPLWDAPLGYEEAAALIRRSELPAAGRPPGGPAGASDQRLVLRELGVTAIFRASRVRIGSGANFKVSFRPARAI